ncbi:hypothetical protein BDV25DRAFT_159913 [Aspergillus avenaceus]|uniref:ER membrane protein complex subunit 2 n=1 Tax=Aspergillus avenaceus TaxID=36643 RepID=A0A5N6TNG3_ASPAV|nr:hypothetical protein BDV25DRAFT_159913 [Aspergillus avenaceus]
MALITHEPHAGHSSNLIATFRLSQQAPVLLKQQLSKERNVLLSLVNKSEEPENHGMTEQLFFACLQSGDDKSAVLCLELLTRRFGSSNERVTALRGLYEEALAENQFELEQCLHKYDALLSDNALNLPISRRRIALLRAMSRPADAIASLVELLKAIPTDAEAWCELADLYHSQGMNLQAIFSLEEALLITPNAWNIHARLGEVLYICACPLDTEDSIQLLRRSIQYFCRSVELCDDYLRGYYGLAMATFLICSRNPSTGSSNELLSVSTEDMLYNNRVEKLNKLAKTKLEDIVERRSVDLQLWEYSQGELIAAKELLDRMTGLH